MAEQSKKVFRCAQEIMEYYDMNRSSFEGYIKMGKPARLINGKWHGHADSIDEFFRRLSAC